MKKTRLIATVLLFVVIFILYSNTTRTVYIDGTQYNVIPECYVCRNTPTIRKKAQLLAKVNRRVITLINYLKTKYGKEHLYVKNLLERYNPDVIYEHSPNIIHPEIAYTMNKGHSLHICIAADGVLQNMEDIMFVMLHEIAHLATNEKGHPRGYWVCFRFILENAVKANIYKPTDYSKHRVMYCNTIELKHNPLFDSSLDSYLDTIPK
jgi:hypothetical protein